MNEELYDVETFPNLFTATFKKVGKGGFTAFEISERRDTRLQMIDHIFMCDLMIGFNNLGFDWIVINYIMDNPNCTTEDIYTLAQEIINSQKHGGPNRYIIWNPLVPQLDLMRVHHFDNKAKLTGLKTLEFNMRMRSIRDMPFPHGSIVPRDGIDTVLTYNAHDVNATELFLEKSADKIAFRRSLNPEWLNYNDGKIGKQFFIDGLTEAGVECFEWVERQHPFEGRRRVPRHTPRPDGVWLSDVILPWISFKTPMLRDFLEEIKGELITDTNGSFARVFELGGIKITFGLGGIHGSVKRRKFIDGVIFDFDVRSYYPNIGIRHRQFPEHLGEAFCDIYEKLYDRRMAEKNGTSNYAALKLALNVPFGDSNNAYGPFFDPAYMLKITINGQLMLLMQAEDLLTVPGLELIQINTDGLTVRLPAENLAYARAIVSAWSVKTKMPVEEKQYRRMFVRDVNNYVGEFMDGSRKAKGAYLVERDWHQNHSQLVVPKGAQAVLLEDADADTFVRLHPDNWDFMLRVKTNVDSAIRFDSGREMKGTIRYYLSKRGEAATKHMAKTTTRLHAGGYHDPVGKRGEWKCVECGHIEKLKGAIEAHISACHASRLVVCQDYDNEPIDIDVDAYVYAINQLTEGFK